MDCGTYGLKGTRESWIQLYLNRRFYSFPKNIDIKTRNGYYKPRDDYRHNYLANIKGYKQSTLDNHALKSGEVNLSDAVVNWHILKEDRHGHGREFVTGHTAVLHEDELFDHSAGVGNKAIGFGLALGIKNLVLHICPTSKNYVQNTTRSGIILDGQEGLPWEKWQQEFQENFPKELKDYLDSLINDDDNDSVETIKKRLNAYKKFYNLTKYKLNKRGKSEVDDREPVEGQSGGTRGGSGSSKSSNGSNAGLVTDYLSMIRKTGTGVKASKINDPFPTLQWVSEDDDHIEKEEITDRAAVFRPTMYRIFANKDFQGFTDAVDHFKKEYNTVNESVIEKIVHETFGQQLIETIAGVWSLKNRKHWAGETFEQAYSPESLTVAVASRYYFYQMISRNVKKESLQMINKIASETEVKK